MKYFGARTGSNSSNAAWPEAKRMRVYTILPQASWRDAGPAARACRGRRL